MRNTILTRLLLLTTLVSSLALIFLIILNINLRSEIDMMKDKSIKSYPTLEEDVKNNDSKDTQKISNPNEALQYSYTDEDISFNLPNENWSLTEKGTVNLVSAKYTQCAVLSFKKSLLDGQTLSERIMNELSTNSINLSLAEKQFQVQNSETITVGSNGIGEVYSIYFKNNSEYFRITYLKSVPEGNSSNSIDGCNFTQIEQEIESIVNSIVVY